MISYETNKSDKAVKKFNYPMLGLNPGPSDSQSDALPVELNRKPGFILPY